MHFQSVVLGFGLSLVFQLTLLAVSDLYRRTRHLNNQDGQGQRSVTHQRWVRGLFGKRRSYQAPLIDDGYVEQKVHFGQGSQWFLGEWLL